MNNFGPLFSLANLTINHIEPLLQGTRLKPHVKALDPRTTDPQEQAMVQRGAVKRLLFTCPAGNDEISFLDRAHGYNAVGGEVILYFNAYEQLVHIQAVSLGLPSAL